MEADSTEVEEEEEEEVKKKGQERVNFEFRTFDVQIRQCCMGSKMYGLKLIMINEITCKYIYIACYN